MTSPATSGRLQITQTCKILVILGSRFLDNGSTDSKNVYSFGNCDSSGSFPVLTPIRHFCSLTQKTGLKSAYRRCSFDTKFVARISRKPFDLESPNFMGISTPTLSTATPDMTSLSISGRLQIAQTCSKF